MARKQTKEEPIAIIPRTVWERPVMIAQPQSYIDNAMRRLLDMPTELERCDSWSNAPTRAIHSAALGGDE
jgi:hypothetical protein